MMCVERPPSPPGEGEAFDETLEVRSFFAPMQLLLIPRPVARVGRWFVFRADRF